MEFSIFRENILQTTHPIIVGIFADGSLSSTGEEINTHTTQLISQVAQSFSLKKAGEVTSIPYPRNLKSNLLIIVALGEKEKYTAKELTTAVKAAASSLFQHDATEAIVALSETLPQANADTYIAQAITDSSYRYTRTFGPQNTKKPVAIKQISLVSSADALAAMQEGRIIGEAINFAKELGNLPGNICTPTYLADTAKNIADQHAQHIQVEVFDRKGIEELKMGAFLAVAKGSAEEPRFIVMQYHGATNKQDTPYTLVGKGLTFDAGGISIKPAANMDEMKYDMCGSATVLAVLKAVAELKLPINVCGIIPSCENLPGGKAYKPGDVLTSLSGQTIEINNTDAEGRLILCDALAYAERLNPKYVIDIATLTGACITALGHLHSGLFGTDDTLIADLLQAGKTSLDTAWHMPLDEEYQQQLQSNFADMVNTGGAPAGSVTAACFLARYTKKYRWAHLDIAGTAWKSGKEKGATGRPVALLLQYLRQKAQQTH